MTCRPTKDKLEQSRRIYGESDSPGETRSQQLSIDKNGAQCVHVDAGKVKVSPCGTEPLGSTAAGDPVLAKYGFVGGSFQTHAGVERESLG